MSSSLSWEDFSLADLSPIQDLVESWISHASAMLDQTERVTGDVIGGPLSADNFESETAEECRAQLRRLAGQFEDDLHDYASVRISATLDILYESLDAQQQNLKDLIDEVLEEKFVIQGGPGSETVELTDALITEINTANDDDSQAAGFEIGEAQARAHALQEVLRTIMEHARTADDDAATALNGLKGEAVDLPPFLGSGYEDAVEAYEEALAEHEAAQREEMLSGEAPPHEVAGWWASLSESERNDLIENERDAIRNLDGIPSRVRHDANIEYLEEYVEANPDDTDAADLLGRVKDDNLMLLGFEPAEQGALRPDGSREPGTEWNVIVATGDPDNADNVGIYVPGTGSDVDLNGNFMYAGTDSYIDYAQRINEAADAADDDADNVTVMWLGFDSPDNIVPEAALSGYASDAAPHLNNFTTGIDATNKADPRITQIGHSYGGVVVGTADQHGSHNAADGVVLVGAPGPGSDSGVAANFNVGSDNVHVVHSDKDAINVVTGTHGVDPRDDFGGNRAESANPENLNPLETHMSYFNAEHNSQSLDNLGNIITGKPTTPHP